jgi:hypothetical protein
MIPCCSTEKLVASKDPSAKRPVLLEHGIKHGNAVIDMEAQQVMTDSDNLTEDDMNRKFPVGKDAAGTTLGGTIMATMKNTKDAVVSTMKATMGK